MLITMFNYGERGKSRNIERATLRRRRSEGNEARRAARETSNAGLPSRQWCTFKDVSLIDSQMPGDPAVVALHANHRCARNG